MTAMKAAKPNGRAEACLAINYRMTAQDAGKPSEPPDAEFTRSACPPQPSAKVDGVGIVTNLHRLVTMTHFALLVFI